MFINTSSLIENPTVSIRDSIIIFGGKMATTTALLRHEIPPERFILYFTILIGWEFVGLGELPAEEEQLQFCPDFGKSLSCQEYIIYILSCGTKV